MSKCDPELHDGDRTVEAAFLVGVYVPHGEANDGTRTWSRPDFSITIEDHLQFACCEQHLVHAVNDVTSRARDRGIHRHEMAVMVGEA